MTLSFCLNVKKNKCINQPAHVVPVSLGVLTRVDFRSSSKYLLPEFGELDAVGLCSL